MILFIGVGGLFLEMFIVTAFQQHALLLIAIWLFLVVVRFRHSKVVLAAGLFAVGLYTLFGLVRGDVSMQALGFGPTSWLPTLGLGVVWLALMLAYSPLADRIATRCAKEPPTLGAFRVLQHSKSKLLGGIVVAWILGAFLEELTLRGIILQSIEGLTPHWLVRPMAAGTAVCVAAAAAALMHLYQGLRATIIIAQLSVLFGVLFVASGCNLWTVVLCHGLYDTIAFIRFAKKKSKYSKFDGDAQ